MLVTRFRCCSAAARRFGDPGDGDGRTDGRSRDDGFRPGSIAGDQSGEENAERPRGKDDRRRGVRRANTVGDRDHGHHGGV